MPQERTEGVVVRGVDFSETSRIVTFLTPNRGRLACMAKGVRRKNSRAAAVLGTFNRVELVYYWKEGRTVQPLAEATLLDGFAAIKKDLEKSVFAAFPVEIAANAAYEDEPSEEMYAVLVQGLEALGAWPGEPCIHACWQAWRLLCAAGFEPSLDTCCVCGKTAPAAAGFSYDGGLACKTCRPDQTLTKNEWDVLRKFAAARGRCPELEQVGAVYEALCRYAARQLDTDLRSVRVIRDMLGPWQSGPLNRKSGWRKQE